MKNKELYIDGKLISTIRRLNACFAKDQSDEKKKSNFSDLCTALQNQEFCEWYAELEDEYKRNDDNDKTYSHSLAEIDKLCKENLIDEAIELMRKRYFPEREAKEKDITEEYNPSQKSIYIAELFRDSAAFMAENGITNLDCVVINNLDLQKTIESKPKKLILIRIKGVESTFTIKALPEEVKTIKCYNEPHIKFETDNFNLSLKIEGEYIEDEPKIYAEFKEKINIRVVCTLDFDYMGLFNNDLALVRKGNKYGYVDKSGKEVISCIYDSSYRFSEGLTRVKKNDRWGYIDKSGKEVVPFIYSGAYPFSEGLARVKKNDRWGYIGKSGKEVVPFIYDDAGDFSEGLACVKKDYKYGYVDRSGKEALPFIYSDAYPFSESLAVIKKNGKYGYIDKSGEEVTPFIFDGACPFSDGLALVKKDGKYGYIDRIRRKVMTCNCDDARSFSEGLAVIKKNGKYGYIDKSDNLAVPFIYDDASAFSEGLAVIKKNGKYGYIDKSGNLVVPYVCDYARDFSDGLACMKEGNKWYILAIVN